MYSPSLLLFVVDVVVLGVSLVTVLFSEERAVKKRLRTIVIIVMINSVLLCEFNGTKVLHFFLPGKDTFTLPAISL
jgi:hypothetical protein